jgi:hypothetical protein
LPPLADDQTHELLITLFPKDFKTDSPHTQKVTLSRFGGTAPVEWRLGVPVIWDPSAKEEEQGATDISKGGVKVFGTEARLRFGVYFRNQLLQSFLIIADLKELGNKRAVRAVCDYSQTRRFGELETLQPRCLSLGVNANAQGTHTLTLADGTTSAAVQWSEGQLSTYTREVRETLYDVLTSAGKSRFDFDPVSLQLVKSAADAIFDGVVRQLAEKGGALYGQLRAKSFQTPLESLLKTVQQRSDEIVQIVLHDPNFAFPWAVMYDYFRPEAPEDKQAKVCRGFSPSGAPCDCLTAGKRYCLRGFWGFRLILEQRSQARQPPPTRVGGGTAATLGYMQAVQDTFVDNLVKALQGISGIQTKEYPDTTPLLDNFRTDRPGLIAFIGHQRNNGTDALPDYELLSSQAQAVLNEQRFFVENDWQLPNSLVLLLACNTGTARVDTGTSLATAFLRLGAIGVLATECSVHTPMIAAFARDLIERLMRGDKIGQAMHHTSLALGQQGCPMGLAFTYLGLAEAQLP